MRRLLLSSFIIVIGFTFIGRLSYLQLFSFSPDHILEDPAIKAVYDYPERGYVYDRKGKLLVGNQPAYDVMVIPRETKVLDTLEFCSLLSITKDHFVKKMKAQGDTPQGYHPYWSLNCPRKITPGYRKKCENIRASTSKSVPLRDYKTNSAANVLGYISEVNEPICVPIPITVLGN